MCKRPQANLQKVTEKTSIKTRTQKIDEIDEIRKIDESTNRKSTEYGIPKSKSHNDAVTKGTTNTGASAAAQQRSAEPPQ